MDKVKQGKRNRINGANFERKVRADLESKGWIVSKWQNNVDLSFSKKFTPEGYLIPDNGPHLIPAKMGRFRSNQGGFPDFVAFRYETIEPIAFPVTTIIAVECKTNGYLDKEEKEKCKWLLENKIFSKILIASKKKVGRKVEVEYNEFK